MKVTCYGPRGSIPAPSRKGFSTVEYGGNTSCYYVEAGPFRVVLDSGSGIANWGDDMMKTGQVGKNFIMLLSHFHWDHLQGMPFAIPFYIGANTFHVHGHLPQSRQTHAHEQQTLQSILAEHQATPHFPVPIGAMPSKRVYCDPPHSPQFSESFVYFHQAGQYVKLHSTAEYKPVDESFIKVTTIPLNHPDGCLGYRIEHMGKVLVYATDTEPFRYDNAQLTKYGMGADMLIMDGQYTNEQLAGGAQSFGHGTTEACIEQATACLARQLKVHHLDPKHDDTKLQLMEVQALASRAATEYDGTISFAKEGDVWEL